MNAAIVTRLLPKEPTVSVLWPEKSSRLLVRYPDALDQRERHAYAAFIFAQSNKAFGVYIGARIAGGMVWVPLPGEIEDATTRAMRWADSIRERREWFRWIPSSSVASTFWPVDV